MSSLSAQFFQSQKNLNHKEVVQGLISLIQKEEWKGLKEYVSYGGVFSRQMRVGDILNEKLSQPQPSLSDSDKVQLYQTLFSSSLVSMKDLNDVGLLYTFALSAPTLQKSDRDALFQTLQQLPDAPQGKAFWLFPLKATRLSKISPSDDVHQISSWLEVWIGNTHFQPHYLAYFKESGLTPCEAFEQSPNASINMRQHAQRDLIDTKQISTFQRVGIQGYLWQKLDTYEQLRFWLSQGLLQSCPPLPETLSPFRGKLLNNPKKLWSIHEKFSNNHSERPVEEEGRVALIWQGPFEEQTKTNLSLSWFEYALNRTHLKEARRWMKLLSHEKPEMVLDPILWLNGFKNLAYLNHNPYDWKAFIALHQEAYERLPTNDSLRKTHESLKRFWKAMLGWSIDFRYISPHKAKHPMLSQIMKDIPSLQSEDIGIMLEILTLPHAKKLNSVNVPLFTTKIRDFIWIACNGFKMASPFQSPGVTATWTPPWVEKLSAIQKTTSKSSTPKSFLLNQFVKMIANHEMLWKNAKDLSILKMAEWSAEDWIAFKQESVYIPQNIQDLFDVNINQAVLVHSTPKTMNEVLSGVVFSWVMHGLDWAYNDQAKERVLNMLSKEDRGVFEYQLQVSHDAHHLQEVLSHVNPEKKSLPGVRRL